MAQRLQRQQKKNHEADDLQNFPMGVEWRQADSKQRITGEPVPGESFGSVLLYAECFRRESPQYGGWQRDKGQDQVAEQQQEGPVETCLDQPDAPSGDLMTDPQSGEKEYP